MTTTTVKPAAPAPDAAVVSLFAKVTAKAAAAESGYLDLGKAIAAHGKTFTAGMSHADSVTAACGCYALQFKTLGEASKNAPFVVKACVAAQLAGSIVVEVKPAGKDRKGNPVAAVFAPANTLTATQAKNLKPEIDRVKAEADAVDAHAAAIAAMSSAEKVKAANIEKENARAKEEQARQDAARALTVKALAHAAAMVENLPGVIAAPEAYAFLQGGLAKLGLALAKAKDAPTKGTLADQLKA